MSLMIFVILIGFGLIFGSFCNAVIWRLHEQALTKKRSQKATRDLSIVHGRSMCVHCHHELAPLDLIPVVSYLLLRGKCRYCGKAIEDKPVVELLTALLFVVSYVLWPYVLTGAAWLLFAGWLLCVVAFVILAVYDLKWYLLPDRVVFPLIGLAIFVLLTRVMLLGGGLQEVITAGWGVLLTAGIFYLIYLFSKGSWIGFGDVKLAIALGILVGGPLPALLLLFIASLTGSIAAVPLLLRGKSVSKTRIPFGPFLLLATVLVMLFGGALSAWYLGLLTV